MAQQTAVEWLFNELDYILELYPTRSEKVKMLFKQAKEIEKENIIEAVKYGDVRGKLETYLTSEQYYNETYGK